MEIKYAIKVNSEFVTNVVGSKDTTREEFVAFIKTYGIQFNDAKDIIEVERVEELPINNLIAFPTQSYMQVDHFAIKTHLNNLIYKYGVDAVIDVFDKITQMGRAS